MIDTDGLDRLVQAHRAITADTDLTAMLERIVRTACEAVGAGYGVLGVLGDGGALDRSVQYGRLNGSTATQTVLEVPIVVGGTAFGTLFLADARCRPFSAEDADFAAAVAGVAATAIRDARLFGHAHRATEWLTASGDIARALLDAGSAQISPLVVRRASEVAEADYGALFIPTPDGRLRVMHTIGVGAADFRGLVFDPVESEIGRSVLLGKTLVIDDVTLSARPGFDNRWNYGPAMLLPLVDPAGIRGAILLARTAGRRNFTGHDAELGSVYAAQVSLAMQFDDARVQRERLRSLEVRHGIARGLHDNVMQRLFAVGVGLQSVENALDAQLEPAVRERLSGHIRALDETIDEIRSHVFDLREEGVRDGGDTLYPHLPKDSTGVTSGNDSPTVSEQAGAVRRPPRTGMMGVADGPPTVVPSRTEQTE